MPSKIRLSSSLPSPSSWLLHSLTPAYSRAASSRSGSSSIYLSRQASDPFVRSSLSSNFVARSAFKLLELQASHHNRMIREGMVIVDLGAAPGGWTQASAQALASKSGKATVGRYKSHGLIVALDLLPLSKALKDMPDVHFIQGDFLSSPVRTKLVQLLRTVSPASKGKVDLVLSDMLANMSGNPLRDAQSSIDLCDAALGFALEHLRVPSVSEGVGEEMKKVAPSLVMKCLQSSLSQAFRDRLRSHFRTVKWEKPSSSRPESREGYWVCSGLKAEVVSGEGAENKESGEGAKEEDDIYF